MYFFTSSNLILLKKRHKLLPVKRRWLYFNKIDKIEGFRQLQAGFRHEKAGMPDWGFSYARQISIWARLWQWLDGLSSENKA
jgi:hypothetical protein